MGGIAFAVLLPLFQLGFTWLCVARIKAVQVARLRATAQRPLSQVERLALALAEAQERQFRAMLEQMTVSIVPQPQIPAPWRCAPVLMGTSDRCAGG